MKKMIPAFAAALFLAPALASAQAPAPSPAPAPAPTQAPAPAPAPISADATAPKGDTARGELVKVDADAKKITIKGVDGVESEFAYNDATEVAGGRDGVAGLATKAGTRVTVTFTTEAGAKTATKIDVQGAKK